MLGREHAGEIDLGVPRLETALERRAERDAARIQLDVDEGRVTMSGTVHSWTERKAVVGAAWGTRGVDAVIDKLHVVP